MKKFFGTDGVRGLANAELTPELAFKLGRAGAFALTIAKSMRNGSDGAAPKTDFELIRDKASAPKVLVAKDGRRSGDMLEAALTAGLCSVGAQVFCAGVIPTPAIAYLVREKKFDAGVMISASHNKMQDNGIKFFTDEGFKLPDETEKKIEELISRDDKMPRPIGADVGMITDYPIAAKEYASFLHKTTPKLNLNGMKIILDCANGATSQIAPMVFKKKGADVIAIFSEPNGLNINENCGSTHMESLQAQVKKHGADIGIAFDGDGDRVLAVCEKGEIIDGDKILAICGLDMKERGKLAKNQIVATVMSNLGFEVFCNDNNMKLHRADVGDRYVLEKMLAEDLNFGGEQSGHIIFRDYNTTGDGILAGLQIVSIMSRKNQSLSVLANAVKMFPQILINVPVANHRKHEFENNAELQKASQDSDARVLVRPSGTEPLIRVMAEARDKEKAEQLAHSIAEIIKKNLAL
jgi:phosphoglucosamine mutase